GDGEGRVGRAAVVPIDLSDLRSVESATERLRESGNKLDVVVFNAAVVPVETQLTAQGLESSFGVNYFGHFFLAKQLLDKDLFVSPSSPGGSRPRLVVVSSEMHKMATPLEEEEVGKVKQFSMSGAMDRYAHSKICLTTFAARLAQAESERVQVLIYDP